MGDAHMQALRHAFSAAGRCSAPRCRPQRVPQQLRHSLRIIRVDRTRLVCTAQQQATAPVTATPPGLATLPWDGTPEQEQALDELERRMAASPVDTPDRETQQWFLRDRKFNVDDAVQKLEAAQQWRRDFRVDEITDQAVAAELASGKAYLHTAKDVNNRPVIVIRVQKHIMGEFPLDDSKRLCVHLLEKAIAELPEGGETLVGIFDLRGFANRNADLGFVRFLVDIFFTYYPKRLGQVIMVDAPFIFKPGWAIVKPWLRKYADLVCFVDRKQLASDFFTPDTLPPDFRQ